METTALIIFIPVLVSVAWVFWGNHEGDFTDLKNIAREQTRHSRSYQDQIDWIDKTSKRHMVYMQTVFCIAISLLLVVLTQNIWFLLTFNLLMAASKLLIGEGFYGMSINRGFGHVGTGGSFDDEITTNSKRYLMYKVIAFILALSAYVLLGNVILIDVL